MYVYIYISIQLNIYTYISSCLSIYISVSITIYLYWVKWIDTSTSIHYHRVYSSVFIWCVTEKQMWLKMMIITPDMSTFWFFQVPHALSYPGESQSSVHTQMIWSSTTWESAHQSFSNLKLEVFLWISLSMTPWTQTPEKQNKTQ